MHIQSNFKKSRPRVLHELIRARPLATFIVRRDSEIVVNHLSLMVSTDRGESGVLKGHVPRINPIWTSLDGVSTKALAVFHGPESYVTPSWYPSKKKNGKAVPTWNYAVVHAHGYPNAVHDPEWLLSHLNQLTDLQESGREQSWEVSQKKPHEDRKGVAEGLRIQGDDSSLAMESLVREHLNLSKADPL